MHAVSVVHACVVWGYYGFGLQSTPLLCWPNTSLVTYCKILQSQLDLLMINILYINGLYPGLHVN
jgi:hypothetical protein